MSMWCVNLEGRVERRHNGHRCVFDYYTRKRFNGKCDRVPSNETLIASHYAGGIWKRMLQFEKASNLFRSHYAGGISPTILDLSHNYRHAISVFSSKSFIFEMSFICRKTKSQYFHFPPVWRAEYSVSEKFCFRDGLVWTVDLTVEINRFSKFFRVG